MCSNFESVDVEDIRKDFNLIQLATGHRITESEAGELSAWLKRLEQELTSWCGESPESSVSR